MAKLWLKIRRSGKTLNKIVITSGDPDFYFGLQPLVKAFPNAKVVATQNVVDHIKATKDAKLAFWGPQMKDGAPTTLVVPQVIASTTFMIDGETVSIEQPDSYAAYVWIPSAKAILGGTGVSWGFTSGQPIPKPKRAANSGCTHWRRWRHISLSA